MGKLWFLGNMFFSTMYLMWRLFFTLPFGYGVISMIGGVALLIVEALGMAEAFVHYANMHTVKDYPLPEAQDWEYPDVDVFIATYSEEVKLLYKTINGCKHMKYPDKDKVHIYLCDDNRRVEMEELAKRMGIHYLKRSNNEGAKAGNLNHALEHSTSPYVVTFDADMIPKSDFLLKTIPYFIDAERKNKGKRLEEQIKLGFVQSPQCFYNPDLFQFHLFSEKRIPNEQDYFYRDIQRARTKTNSVIYGGSNTVLSREALLEAGGFYTEAITEDFATGLLIQKKGYVSLAIDEVLASGLSVTDLKNLIQQRTRWARGVIATGRKLHIFTAKDLSLAQKLNYWASIWYWYAPVKRLIYIMSVLLYATFDFMVFRCTLLQVLLFWLPMYISSNISLKKMSRNVRNTKWTSIYETALFPFLLLPVVLETIGISLKKFKVTGKEEQKNEKGKNVVYAIPFLILLFLSVIGVLRCIFEIFESGSMGPIVVIFWLIYYIFLLVMSLFFIDGRVPYRKAERTACTVSVRLFVSSEILQGVSKDISETGISVLLDFPDYIEVEDNVRIEITTENGLLWLDAVVVFVVQEENKWRYAMKITDYLDSYEEYLQLIYDRVPDIPLELKKYSGSFEDLKLNLEKRMVMPFYQKRKAPRIEIQDVLYAPALLGEQAEVCDFNYFHITIKSREHPWELLLYLSEEVYFQCTYIKRMEDGKQLYRIRNIKEIMRSQENYKLLKNWLLLKGKNCDSMRCEQRL